MGKDTQKGRNLKSKEELEKVRKVNKGRAESFSRKQSE